MENSKITNLPIFKHFEASEIGKQTDSFRKGEKGLFWFVKVAALCALIYFSWVYILPPLFIAIGEMLAIASTLVIAVGLIIAAPVILKGLRRLTRFLHKMVIKHDPFGELDEQRVKIIKNKQKFQTSKGKVDKLKNDMFRFAAEAEEKAKKLQKRIVSLSKKVTETKVKMAKIVKEKGKDAQLDDEYINLHAQYNRDLSESQRRTFELEQQTSFVSKYGARGDVMKKLGHKLTLVEVSMDNKILDFDATIDILKRDYEFAKNSKEATSAAKSAMMFSEGWEFEYALDVVTSTIAQDIAITAGNLKDIDTYTANFNVDSDELFESLNLLADDINVGKNIIPNAKAYASPDYQQTHEDRLESSKFGGMF